MERLARKVAIVTGAASALGAADAALLAEQGARVVDHSYRVDRGLAWLRARHVLFGGNGCLRGIDADGRRPLPGQGYPIRCNAILPGAQDSPMTRAALADGPETEARLDRIRVGLQGAPSDLAHLVAFMASDESRPITGTTIVTDSSQTAK